MKLFLIEDDKGLADGISFALRRERYDVRCASSVKQGRKLLDEEIPDAILLDLNLPDGDGMEFCREIRRSSQVPILMLTARDMETDEIEGLLSGADDYVTKPFSLAVLKVRLETVLRRSRAKGEHRERYAKEELGEAGRRYARTDTAGAGQRYENDSAAEADQPYRKGEIAGADQPYRKGEIAGADQPYRKGELVGADRMYTDYTALQEPKEAAVVCGRIRLYPDRMQVFCGEREVECSATEYRLLQYLLANRGQVLLKEQILERVWDRTGSFVDENTLQVTIRRLRRKLGDDAADPEYIRTVRGMGYIFVG